MTEQIIQNLKDLVEKGYGIKRACDMIDMKYDTAYYYIRTRGIKPIAPARRHYVDDFFFDSINSEEKAYLLGFFIGDGCINIENTGKNRKKNTCRFTIANSIDDLEIIEAFQKYICPTIKIQYSNCQLGVKFRKTKVAIRWSSSYMFKIFTEKYNIHPRKTYHNNFKFPFELIPENLYNHFIRGFFDADGSFTYIQKEDGSIKQFGFSFIFSSEEFCNQFADIFESRFKMYRTVRPIKSKNMITWQLRFRFDRNRRQVLGEVFDWLYKDSTLFLQRKKLKINKYLNTVLSIKLKKFIPV